MFKEIGQFASMMKNLPKLKASIEEMQKRLGELVAEGTAGGGMVTVKMNGRLEVVSCVISEDALKLNDREMLEDLIVAATNQAITKMNQTRAEETAKIATSLGLPVPPPGGMPGRLF